MRAGQEGSTVEEVPERDALRDICEERGRLTPEVVVEEARPTGHPLHHRFEWDDEAAGSAWRWHQAHDLIRSFEWVEGGDLGTDAVLYRA